MEIEIDEEVFLPKYRPLVETALLFDIDFLYGGRDSGKSRHIAQQLIIDCLSAEYFRCVLIRKVKDTIKGSQWQLIKDVCEQWGLSHLFKFTTSPLEIKCVNGNGFIARGCDEPGKIKSIANPSHAWIEEGNQLEKDDFTIIMSSLRSDYGKVKTWFSFNPECEGNYTDFWLYQEWFEHTTALSFEHVKSYSLPDGKEVKYHYRATHSTYLDNPYCSDERKALYESYKGSKNNAYWYQTYTLGLWGYRRTGGEFWKCFDEEKHTADFEPADSYFHISLDKNYNPYISIQIWQVDPQNKLLSQIDEIACAHPYNNATKSARRFVNYLIDKNYNKHLFIYGDPSARAHSTEDDEGRSFYDKFLAVLSESGYRFTPRVENKAPEVARSGEFINEIYESNFEGWKIRIATRCRKSIEDYNMVKEDQDGKMAKITERDKDKKVSFQPYGHFSDAKRYFITSVLGDVYKRFKSRRGGVRGFSV